MTSIRGALLGGRASMSVALSRLPNPTESKRQLVGMQLGVLLRGLRSLMSVGI